MQPQSPARRLDDENILGFVFDWLGALCVSAVKKVGAEKN